MDDDLDKKKNPKRELSLISLLDGCFGTLVLMRGIDPFLPALTIGLMVVVNVAFI